MMMSTYFICSLSLYYFISSGRSVVYISFPWSLLYNVYGVEFMESGEGWRDSVYI